MADSGQPGVNDTNGTQTAGNNGIHTNPMSGVDYNHPLFLHPSDVSGTQIVSSQLTGVENYSMWYRSMRIALLGRNKLGLVDGSCVKSKFPELGNLWERVNAVVLSWILNAVSKHLLGGIMYASMHKKFGTSCMKGSTRWMGQEPSIFTKRLPPLFKELLLCLCIILN